VGQGEVWRMSELRKEKSARNGECAQGLYIVWGSGGGLQFVWARISAWEFRFLPPFFFPLSRWPVLCWDINLIRMLGGRDINSPEYLRDIMGGINRRGLGFP
jgi:hypothetical protein